MSKVVSSEEWVTKSSKVAAEAVTFRGASTDRVATYVTQAPGVQHGM